MSILAFRTTSTTTYLWLPTTVGVNLQLAYSYVDYKFFKYKSSKPENSEKIAEDLSEGVM